MRRAGDLAAASDLTGLADALRRKAYLSHKGINPNEPCQLNLAFPDTVADLDHLRHMPNDYGRSALFTVTNKNKPRRNLLREPIFHYNEEISLLYTGIELRAEDDELFWLQMLHYGASAPFGQAFEFDIKDLVHDLGWYRNSRYYEKARECLSRQKATEVLIQNNKAYGSSGAISLIQNYTAANDGMGKPTRYRVWLDPNLIVLFAGNTFTSQLWQAYRRITPVARRLADYIKSHACPYPLHYLKFKKMCGSKVEGGGDEFTSSELSSWRQNVRKACRENELAGIAKKVLLDKNGYICTVR